MAIEVCCSEDPGSGVSPRNSFSYELESTDDGVRLDSTLLDSGSEFDFCFGSSCSVQQVSPADELFSDGKILPVQIKKDESFPHTVNYASLSSSSSSSSSSFYNQREPEKKMRLKEFLLTPDSDFEDKPKGLFLQFKRSISLNYDKSRNSKSLIRSLHFLSRSNSTGSALNPKPNLPSKETHYPHNLPKHTSHLKRSSSLSASVPYYHSKKPLGRNSFGNGNGNGNGGIRVSPVLNFPPPAFISNVADGFFSIGLLCNGKNNRKTM